MQEKESIKCKKGGLEPQKQRFGSTKVKVWQHESKGLTLRNINKNHPRRSIRASASVDTSIRVGRYEHPRRSMRMTKVGIMKKKRDGMNEGKEEREAEERGVQAWGKRGAWEVCQNSLILKKSQSPDFHKPGLCYV